MRDRVEPPMAALAAAIRERDAPRRMAEDFAAYLRAHQIEGADLEAMLKVGPDRFLVYRRLVHNRMRNAIREFIPRTIARRGKEAFERDFEAFIEEKAAKSPYLREVPAEFVDWIVPRWRVDAEVAAYLPDLARHELLEIDVRNTPRGGEPQTGLPLALDRPLRFDGSARLMRYEHAVHRLPLSRDDRSEPPPVPTSLLVYRDLAGKVRYLELTPLARAILEELLENKRQVAEGLRTACEKVGETLDDEKLGIAAQLLADLADRKVMLGAEP